MGTRREILAAQISVQGLTGEPVGGPLAATERLLAVQGTREVERFLGLQKDE